MSNARNLARLARRGVIEVDTAQDVRELALFGAYPEEVITRGAVTRTDGGGARWRWNETSEAVDAGDPAPTLMPVGHTGAGRWEMVVEGDVFVECFGLPSVSSGDNAAQAWTDANLYAWRNGHRRVTLKSRRDGMRLWGVIPCSRVIDDLKGSIIEPYAPPVPEGTAGYHLISVGAHGAAVQVPTAFVSRYNLRSETIVNAMIDDPDMNIDHRYLHPDSPSPNPGVTWIELKAGQVFDPRGRIWVVEGNTYPTRATKPPGRADGDGDLSKPNAAQKSDIFAGKDRILIFEDADGDGSFESRKVFIEGLNLVSGIELSVNGRKVAWSIADYLTSLEERITDLVTDSEMLPSKAEEPHHQEAEAKP